MCLKKSIYTMLFSSLTNILRAPHFNGLFSCIARTPGQGGSQTHWLKSQRPWPLQLLGHEDMLKVHTLEQRVKIHQGENLMEKTSICLAKNAYMYIRKYRIYIYIIYIYTIGLAEKSTVSWIDTGAFSRSNLLYPAT